MPPEDNPADDVPADKDAYDEWAKKHEPARKPATYYDAMKRELDGLLDEMSHLSGDTVGPSDRKGWPEGAMAASVHAFRLAHLLRLAGWAGRHEPFLAFPSPNDWGIKS